MTIPEFQKQILFWYRDNKRDLPWRKTTDPYKILVSEIMLQQTQVSRVLPKYELFLQEFPDIYALAKASNNKLLEVWSGLGYWRRARFLKETAQTVVTTHNGKFPRTPKELQTLPGIGPYTAGAVACFAFGSTEPFIDTNIRRIYLHFFFPNQENVSDTEILKIATKAVDIKDPRNWHWALFDYGAMQLKAPRINRRSKHYNKQSAFKDSFRSFRAKTVRHILATPTKAVSKHALLDFLEDELRKAEKDYAPQEILDALAADKLIQEKDGVYSL